MPSMLDSAVSCVGEFGLLRFNPVSQPATRARVSTVMPARMRMRFAPLGVVCVSRLMFVGLLEVERGAESEHAGDRRGTELHATGDRVRGEEVHLGIDPGV